MSLRTSLDAYWGCAPSRQIVGATQVHPRAPRAGSPGIFLPDGQSPLLHRVALPCQGMTHLSEVSMSRSDFGVLPKLAKGFSPRPCMSGIVFYTFWVINGGNMGKRMCSYTWMVWGMFFHLAMVHLLKGKRMKRT